MIHIFKIDPNIIFRGHIIRYIMINNQSQQPIQQR
jgi:hypothetical protein